jgi:hypothetical protein
MTFMSGLMQESCILAYSGNPAGFRPESGIPAHGAGEGARIGKICQNLPAGGGIWQNSGTTSLAPPQHPCEEPEGRSRRYSGLDVLPLLVEACRRNGGGHRGSDGRGADIGVPGGDPGEGKDKGWRKTVAGPSGPGGRPGDRLGGIDRGVLRYLQKAEASADDYSVELGARIRRAKHVAPKSRTLEFRRFRERISAISRIAGAGTGTGTV